MKTIKDFQANKNVALENKALKNVVGGKADTWTQKRETYCTGANGGDSEISYLTDSGVLFSHIATTV